MSRKPHRTMVALLAATAVAVPVGASAASGGMFSAQLDPIPHAASADGGSNVTGDASLKLTGRKLTVDLNATGLTPNEPHAMHIHGVLDRVNECPTASADTDGDGLVSLAEGDPFYGPIDVSFTNTGATDAESGLALERFAEADASGTLTYHRQITVSKAVAKNLTNLHIVVHGADLPADADHSSLSSFFEATLPVACGDITR
jgi:Cu/Zn superoxide dismutase